jgi:hypothetical protein
MDRETADEIKRAFDDVAALLRADIHLMIEGVRVMSERIGRIEKCLDRIELRLDRLAPEPFHQENLS